MAPGAVQTYTCTVVVGQNDFTNVANVTGTPPVGPNVTDNDNAVVDVIHPAIDIQKTPDLQQVQPGATVTFTIRVENTGDVTLAPVVVSDPLAPELRPHLRQPGAGRRADLHLHAGRRAE